MKSGLTNGGRVISLVRATLLFSLMVWFAATVASGTAWASSTGKTGYSGNPATNSGNTCITSCHGGGATPTVQLTGSANLAPGASGVYTLTIAGGAASVGGLDVSTTGGTLQATGSGTKLSNGEVTHTTPASFTSGSLSFTFTLVAPSTAGQITLYAVGLSANGDGMKSGDYAAATTKTVTVAAPPAPQITVTDSVAPNTDLQIPFGTISDGLTFDQTVTITNSGGADLVIGTFAGVSPLAAPFSITTDNCSGQTIAPAATCTVTVRFSPASAGPYSDTFDIPSNDPNTATVTMSVSGTGSATPVPHIVVTDSVSPNNDLSIPFGDVTEGATSDQTVTITNIGNANLVMSTLANANPLAAPFTITADNCSNKTIVPAATCTVTVRFAPVSAGASSDAFDIPSNDNSFPSVVMSVSGTGIAPAPVTTNNPPTSPALVSPSDGQAIAGSAATLQWNKSSDPDGDALTYHVYYCTASDFSGCAPIDVASSGLPGMYIAGSGLVFIGFVVTNDGRRKRIMLMIMIAMLVITAIVASCGGGGGAVNSTPTGSSTPPSADMSHQISSLNSATTYYWKVVADDGKGGLASSETWSFKTQ